MRAENAETKVRTKYTDGSKDEGIFRYKHLEKNLQILCKQNMQIWAKRLKNAGTCWEGVYAAFEQCGCFHPKLCKLEINEKKCYDLWYPDSHARRTQGYT